MFTKRKHVGSVHGFKKVTDWDAVWGAVFIGFLLLIAVSSCAG